jgi:IMP dehydrogenase/GMP reductase
MSRKIHTEPSRTLMEYRLLPGLTTPESTFEQIDLQTALVAPPDGGQGPLLQVPIIAAAMQAVSGSRLAIAMARLGGLGCIFGSQGIDEQAAMVAAVKSAAPESNEALLDSNGALFAAAALNTHDYKERLPALVQAGLDAAFLDSSDGHSFYQGRALSWIAEEFPNLCLIGGNIITGRGFDYLVGHGAQAVKVGMGGGSICITQEQKGTGRGLATSVVDVAAARDRHREATGRHIPIIADGGLGTARDVVIALALGADYVMMGRFFAGVDESPNPVTSIDQRPMKAYWGEGSARAKIWKSLRYNQEAFEEGVEGYVDATGPLAPRLAVTLAKVKASMSSCGCPTIAALHRDAELEVVSALSIREGEVHDIYRLPEGAK